MFNMLLSFITLAGLLALPTTALPVSNSSLLASNGQSRLDTIRSMYGWEGFVYALDVSGIASVVCSS